MVACAGDIEATNDQLMDQVRTMIDEFANQFLPAAGYTNTRFEGHIFAAKNGCLVDVFLPCWQVTLCVGPSQAVCDVVGDEVFRMLAGHLQEVAI